MAFLSGVVAVAGFAPWGLFPLSVLSLALLFLLWIRAKSARTAALLGFFFGLGLLSAGIGWLYIALHEFGYMPLPLALLATLLFVSFYALFAASVGWLQAKFSMAKWVKLLLLMPALWVLAELLRGYLFTGFPWLVLGYAQVPHSPLAGFAPALGVYGVSLVAAVSAGALVLLVQQHWGWQSKWIALLLVVLWGAGAVLGKVEWSQPEGEPVKVSLLQGNIAQDDKFAEEQLVATLETYRRLAQGSDARLIVFPETALPILRSNLPERYAEILRDHGRQYGGDVLIGSFEEVQNRYYNVMFSVGTSSSQIYRKNHMVPFGEYVPLRPVLGWLIDDVLKIPMSDQSGGGADQPLLRLAGQRIAMNICFEDVFGEEIIRALPQATLLLNTSNDAWYGESSAAIQHNQIAQMRALETGRMMLRATNTGVTSVIDRDGHIVQMLPQHEEGVLTATVQGYAGVTPYVRWGNVAVFFILVLMLLAVWRLRRGTSFIPIAG